MSYLNIDNIVDHMSKLLTLEDFKDAVFCIADQPTTFKDIGEKRYGPIEIFYDEVPGNPHLIQVKCQQRITKL